MKQYQGKHHTFLLCVLADCREVNQDISALLPWLIYYSLL